MTEATTGVDVLRRTVHARNRSPHALALIAREVEGVSTSMLEDFAAGKIDLGIAALQALTKELYPHAEFDVESGMLRSTNRSEPRSLGVRPEPFDPRTLPYYSPASPGAHLLPLRQEKPPAKKPRPGWLGGWL
ncbi:hypothetical protein AAFX91_27950 [Bradyrhizobium sp. 31Argb]|uniref:hypothetical protein n=1 Tax=Bradyrhizobium sp. 31Argb TaxID=3141247 RepID=UPI003747B9D7